MRAIPLFLSTVRAGFPSPAEDYIEKKLDLNELVVQHPVATFFVRVEGRSMEEAGIHSGDILVVDRSLEAVNGKIVVAMLGGDFTVKRLRVDSQGVFLMPENPSFSPIKVEEECAIWGVVSYIIHKA
jgi:DNA polymerase V